MRWRGAAHEPRRPTRTGRRLRRVDRTDGARAAADHRFSAARSKPMADLGDQRERDRLGRGAGVVGGPATSLK